MNVTVMVHDTATGEIKGQLFWVTDDHEIDLAAVKAAITNGDFDVVSQQSGVREVTVELPLTVSGSQPLTGFRMAAEVNEPGPKIL